MAAIGGGALLWPLIDSFNPSAAIDPFYRLDISHMQPGDRWKPHDAPFIIHYRTDEERERAASTTTSDLLYPALDSDRVIEPNWFIAAGWCPGRDCLLAETRNERNPDVIDGWHCPCDGAHFDLSGRTLRGPVPANIMIPDYEFEGPAAIKIHRSRRAISLQDLRQRQLHAQRS